MSTGRSNRIKACLLTLLLAAGLAGQAAAVGTSAAAAVLMDVDSGRVLYAQNPDKQMLIASTTKIMTALVAIEQGDLGMEITVERQDMAEGSSMYLRPGETLTLEALLYGLMLCSGNDAALAIARAVGGSQEGFVRLMNRRAEELGMENTAFANPNGLDAEGHYSTAMDMARLACAAVENETLVRIASTKSMTIGGRTMHNHNKLLSRIEGCIGLKTGYTKAAGRTLVSCVQRGGQRLVAVTLQDGNDWLDHQQLYEFGFTHYPSRTIIGAGEQMAIRLVRDGLVRHVPILAGSAFSWPAAEGETLTVELHLPDELSAPFEAGEPVGEALIMLEGREVGRVPLVCGAAASAADPAPIPIIERWRAALLGA